MVHLPYEVVHPWERWGPITQESMHRISRNQDFINQLKLEARLRNINPANGDARRSPASPFKMDNLMTLSDQITVRANKLNTSPNLMRMTGSYAFPQNDSGKFFDQNFLPVVNISYVSGNYKRRAAVVIRSITTTGVDFVVQSFNAEWEIGISQVSLHIFAIGVKGKMIG